MVGLGRGGLAGSHDSGGAALDAGRWGSVGDGPGANTGAHQDCGAGWVGRQRQSDTEQPSAGRVRVGLGTGGVTDNEKRE